MKAPFGTLNVPKESFMACHSRTNQTPTAGTVPSLR
jgi:hypothetical protein